ncbi:MAG TPA: MBL fold metallo-hydrolase [Streptosporangiaceae bacterium]|nr:MBL fold metallo-hydrolase [Streptosporangiaceae bacterium]
MRMTKLGHSCVRLENDGQRIVLDPGVWSGADVLAGASAVLITHEHADHLDAGVVRAALERDAAMELWTNPAVAAQFDAFGDRVHAVGEGDAFTVAGFDVRVYGRDHAAIHPDLPVISNIGFAVDGKLFHPGDSFTMPGEQVENLLLPISAPWLKAAEVFDYARAVGPSTSYAIHDEVLSANGIALMGQLAGVLLGGAGQSGYARLEPGRTVDL